METTPVVTEEDPVVSPQLLRDFEEVTLEAELVEEDAERVIEKAVTGRRGIARKYVRRVRRRHPDATPAEIIMLLERHYITAISVAQSLVRGVQTGVLEDVLAGLDGKQQAAVEYDARSGVKYLVNEQ